MAAFLRATCLCMKYSSLGISWNFFFQDIRHFSAIPSEEEVLFPPNSQFKVEQVLTNEQEKKSELNTLAAYDMSDLDVYILKQTV